jgi:hypothetical protein
MLVVHFRFNTEHERLHAELAESRRAYDELETQHLKEVTELKAIIDSK